MIYYRLLFVCLFLFPIGLTKADEPKGGDAVPTENAAQAPAVRVMRLSGSGSYYLEEIESMVKHYLPDAEQGDPQAQRALGGIYLGSEAPEKGIEWYRKAAEQKDTLAMLELGNCYQRGRGVGKDINEALKWYFEAVEHGNSQGYIRVADLCDEGREVPENKAEALRLYRLAAEKKNPQGQFQVGNYYFNGIEVPQDKVEAVRWYHKSIENGGWVLVQFQLGLCYFNGEGVHQDKEEAVKWFRQAAERDYWHAQHQLGYCYFYGQGIAQDKEEGVQWFRKAEANGGHWKAQYELGKCYLYGEVLPQDRARAIEMLRKAAGSGRGGTEVEAAANLLKEIEEDAKAEREAVARGDYVPAVMELSNARVEFVRSVAFSPDGTKILAAGAGGRSVKVRIYDAQTGKEIKILEVLAEPLNNYVATMRRGAWSSDGKKIVIAASDGTARILEVESGKELHKLTGHADEVHSAAFSPDGKKVVTASKDGTVRIWDAESGKELRQMDGHKHGPIVIDGATGLRVNEGRVHAVHYAEFSSDGKKIVTAGFDYTVRIWDAESGKELHVLQHGPGYIVQSAAFSPDDKRVLASGTGGVVQIWDAESGEELTRLGEYGPWVFSAVWSPDGKKIVSTASGGGKGVHVWDVESGEALHRIDRHAGETVFDVAWSPDGERIITAGGNGAVLIIDLERLAEQERQPPLVRPPVSDF